MITANTKPGCLTPGTNSGKRAVASRFNGKKTTVVLCDDHTVFREGLRLLLETAGDIEVVGEAANGHRALGEAKRLKPDVVLMDVAMPLLNGVEAVRLIAREAPAVKVIMLSSYSDEQYVRHAVAAGASGYVMKETASNDIFQAIRETSKGKAYFSPAISFRLARQWRDCEPGPQSQAASRTAAPALGSRQTEVLQLIAEGYSSKQIGSLLMLSIKTVERHRQLLMRKLDIHEIATLTRYAVSCGIVESKPYAQLTGHAKR
ncbi:MAG TPA: response regulator transcription factor [Verrucomicrobiae bacterium]|nr:response regulator transcription factor [Verrucomicrobiae bacterium]